MRMSDMQSKDIIDYIDGKKVGNITDIETDKNGCITNLIVRKKYFFSIFKHSEQEIKWTNINKIGEDVILVKID